jgi:hypothetical protein
MTAAHDFDWYIDRVDVARWSNTTPGARDAHVSCPVHGGSDSLHLTEKGGKVLLKCFASDCTIQEVIDALDGSAPISISRKKRSRKEVGREVFTIRGPDGKVAARHTRVDYDDGSKEFFWPKGTKPADVPLYGSEDIAGFDPAEPVIVTEGERKRDRLKAEGYQAVALAGGSSVHPSAGVLSVLKGLEVILWPDNDEPGRHVMAYLARSIAGSASSVRLVEWPDAPEHGDAADFLDTHSVEECDALLKAAPPWSPRAYDEDFVSEWASDLDRTPPKPLLLDYLEPDDYTILFGDGGTGKGVVAAWWVANLTLDDWVVILLDYEQNTLLEWAPRVERFGGDLSRLRVVQPTGAIWSHAERVREEAEWARDERGATNVYLVVDSIGYAIGDAKLEESGSATKYKKALNAIGLPTLSLAHTTKANADSRWPFGSVYWHNNVRHTIGISRKDEAEDSPRVLRNRKVNRRAPFPTVEIDWSWVHGDLPDHLDFAPSGMKTIDRIAAALDSGPLTVAEIASALDHDGNGAPVSEAAVKKALSRGEEFDSDGAKPARWRTFGASLRASIGVGG